jgi:hypothetical protein
MIGPRCRWQVGVAGVPALLTVGAAAAPAAAVLGDGRVFYFGYGEAFTITTPDALQPLRR